MTTQPVKPAEPRIMSDAVSRMANFSRLYNERFDAYEYYSDRNDEIPTEAKYPKHQMSAERRRSSLTASVSRFEMSDASWRTFKFGNRSWQDEAWRLYDVVGQIRFVSNWIGSRLSRSILRVHEVAADGNNGAVVDDSAPEGAMVAEFASGPLGIGDARAEAFRLLGIDLFVVGEAFIIAEADGGASGEDSWFVVTARQIKRTGDQITITRPPIVGGGTMTYRDGTDLILRVWTPHPADTNEPDSPVRSAIPALRLIETIMKRKFAELDSRLIGAGVLFVPDTLDFPAGENDEIGTDGFASQLMRTAATSLRDRSSAEAVVPIIVSGPAEDLEYIKHITFWSELSAQLDASEERATVALAQSLDIPPEVMLGLGSSNHWSAWAISEGAVNEHIAPLATRIASALTLGYLQPGLESADQDPGRYTYQFDLSALTARTNRSADAVEFHKLGLVSDAVAREAGAWDETDKPDEAERLYRVALSVLEASPQVALADPGIRKILGIPGTAAAPAGDSDGQRPADTGQPTSGEDGPPANLPGGTDRAPVETAAIGLSTAVKLSARRAMALAGSKLIPHGRRPATVAKHALAATAGPVESDRLPALLSGGWDDLGVIASAYQLDVTALRCMLIEFCSSLLASGMAYDDDLIDALLRAPGVLDRLSANRQGARRG